MRKLYDRISKFLFGGKIGLKHQITYLYVPTVVQELEYQYKNVFVFKTAIDNVYKKLGYEKALD